MRLSSLGRGGKDKHKTRKGEEFMCTQNDKGLQRQGNIGEVWKMSVSSHLILTSRTRLLVRAGHASLLQPLLFTNCQRWKGSSSLTKTETDMKCPSSGASNCTMGLCMLDTRLGVVNSAPRGEIRARICMHGGSGHGCMIAACSAITCGLFIHGFGQLDSMSILVKQ